MKQISNLEPLKRTRSIHSTRPAANAKSVLWASFQSSLASFAKLKMQQRTDKRNALFDFSWKLNAIHSKPWMPASQMMGFKRRREPFCDGKTFFDDAALKAALGGCAASLRGRSITIRK